MILPDVNVLIYAHREECERHGEYKTWLEGVLGGSSSFGVSDLVLSGCLRILTHPRVFDPPTPGPRHWAIFRGLCEQTAARGNLVPDAFLAALAIESGSEWITTDRDYAQFPGLSWRHPLA